MATVYLHIGAPKTATSTLQHVLAKNYRRLLKHGFLYPRDVRHSDAHHALACDLLETHLGVPMEDIWYGDVPRGEAWSLLRDEIERHAGDCHSVIVSSELFFSQSQSQNLDSMLRDVIDYLPGHEVRIIVYLRRQDQLFSSFYNQDVKGIRQWQFSAYQFYLTHQIFQHSYPEVLNAWREVLGRESIFIRPFEPSQWPRGEIVRDVCETLGLPSLRGGNVERNDSLSMAQLYIKLCLNKIGFDKSLNEEVVRIIREIGPEKSIKDCVYINRALYQKYRQGWIEDNRIISRDYLGGAELFKERIPEAGELRPFFVQYEAVLGFVFHMIEQFKAGNYHKHRQLFARAALLMIAERKLWSAFDQESRLLLLEWADQP